MAGRFSLLLISVIASSLLATVPFSFSSAVIDTGITVSRLTANSDGIGSSISATLSNDNDEQQPVVVIFEIRDGNGITSNLQLKEGVLGENSQRVFSASWTPEKEGTFIVRVFAISSLSEPIVLTGIKSANLAVEEEEQQPPSEVLPEPEFNSSDLEELIQYTLDRINEDRADFDLAPVELGTNKAAQIHAEDVFATKQLSHWMTNGEKPYMTYTRYAGSGSVGQNVAISGFSDDHDECVAGILLCAVVDPREEIDRLEYAMMYEDEECCQNGHRDNILDARHTHVSIGIAYDDYFLSLVQNFENNYVESDSPVTNEESKVRISGEFSQGSIYTINVFYDELPTAMVYEQNKDKNYYDQGALVAIIAKPLPPGYYYETPEEDYELIVADVWEEEDGQSIDIQFDLDSVMQEKGVYTVYTYAQENENEDGYDITSYSIFYR